MPNHNLLLSQKAIRKNTKKLVIMLDHNKNTVFKICNIRFYIETPMA